MTKQKQCAYWFLTINPSAECYSAVQTILDNIVEDYPNAEYSYIYHHHKEKDDIVNTHLWGFWNDEQHLKNMLGLSKGYNNCYGDELGDIYLRKPKNKWEERKINIIAKNLIKAGYKVTCNDYCEKQIIYNEDGKDYKLV